MSDIKWIKVTVDLFDDEKIALIESMPNADSILVIWFKLLCFAGKQNNGGIFILNDRNPYTEVMLAAIFRRTPNAVRLALKTFEELGMIEIVDGVVTIPNWKKHQSMMDRNEYQKLYMREYRERKKLESQTSVTNDVNNKLITSEEMLGDKNKEERNKNKEKESKHTRFIPPTYEEVSAYCKERNNGIDPHRFVDWYQARNWKDIKDWKACVRTWEQRNKKPVANETDDEFWKAVERMNDEALR